MPGVFACDPSPGGICTAQKSCDQTGIQTSAGNGMDFFTLKLQQPTVSEYYILVPVSIFAETSTDNQQCFIQVEYSQDETTVVGSLLFEKYYGYFTNTYDD